MRYILLGSTMMSASFMLPFVDMSAKPKGQPVDAVEISVLETGTGAAPARPDATAALGLPPTMPMAGALWVAGIVPFGAIGNIFSDDDTETAKADPTRIPLMFAMLPSAMPQTEMTGKADMAEMSPPEERAVPPVLPQVTVAEIPAEIVPQVVPVAETPAVIAETRLPVVAETPLPVEDIASDVIIASIPNEPGLVQASFETDNEALTPLTENVGSLSLDTSAATALTVIEVAPAPVVPEPTETADAAPEVQDEPPQQPGLEISGIVVDPATPEPMEIVEAAPDTQGTPPQQPVVEMSDAEQDAEDEATLMQVTATYLNLRSGPSSSHSVVFGLSRGDEAELLEEELNGWARLRVPETGQEGWAFGRYLTEASDDV